MHLQEQMTWEKKLYDAFLLSLQLIQNWLFGCQFVLKSHTVVSSRNRRKGYYTDGAPSAKWLWSLMIIHLSMVIPGVGGRGVNSPWGHMWAWSPGFVDICCQFLAQDGGLDCFCNFIAEFLRKRPQLGFVIYLAEMAGRENNEGSIENVVLSNSLTVTKAQRIPMQ